MATYYRWRKSAIAYTTKDSEVEPFLTDYAWGWYVYYGSSIKIEGNQIQIENGKSAYLQRDTLSVPEGWYFTYGASAQDGRASYVYKAAGSTCLLDMQMKYDTEQKRYVYALKFTNSCVRMDVTPTAGDFQEYVYSTNASAYPNGGVSGSYYYDQRTTVTSPTNPGSITVPESIKGGETISISWTAASGVAANVSGYEVERSTNGGSSWAQIYRGSSRSTTNLVEKGTPSVMYRVRAYDSNGQYSAYTTSPNRTVINNEPPSAPGSISVTPPVSGQTTEITITAATDPDGTIASYQYERSVDSNGWTQLINADQLTYTDTVNSEWGTVAYRVCAIDNEGAAGPYATSETFTVNTGWLIISGPDEDMGPQPAPFTFSVSANITGSTDQTGIAMVITLDGVQIYSDTVNAGQTVTETIDTRLMGEGEHTIAVSVSKEDYLPTSRAYVFTVPGVELPSGGRMTQLENSAGSAVFPVTLARAVIGEGGKSIAELLSALTISQIYGANIVMGTYQGSGTFGSTDPKLLALPFTAKILFVLDNTGSLTVIVPSIGSYIPHLDGTTPGTVTTEGQAVSWYASTAADQLNSVSTTYTYIAIG